jgi:hypothetical protein
MNFYIKHRNYFKTELSNHIVVHAKNGGEHQVGVYFLDEICWDTKEIFEFNGCLVIKN